MGEAVLKEGYLIKAPDVSKHLHNFKKWQRKWFQLNTSGDLYFYENDKTSKPTGLIHLLQCSRLFDAQTKGIQTSFCCGVDMGDNIYYLKAESAKTFSEWIKPMSEFADVCEIDLGTLDERRGSIMVGERHGTFDDGRRSTLSEEDRHDTNKDPSESSQIRHLSVTTSSKFLSKEGWLSKTGSNNKGWKERYFKLKNGKLYYYKDTKSDSALGEIDLFHCTSIDSTQGKKGHGIDLQMPTRVYNLSADSKKDCDDWFFVLSHTLALIADIKDPSSSLVRSGSNASSISTEGGATPSSISPFVTRRSRAEDPVGVSGEDKDSVVQLLEAEVEALRGQLASLQDELRANTARNSQLQQQLSEIKNSHSSSKKELLEEKEQLSIQVSRLEKAKRELETINDSVQTQLEEQLGKVQELEDELMITRQDLDEAHANNAAIEEDLTETQQKLQEIEVVAQDLEAALRKRESEPVTPVSTTFKGLHLHTDSEDRGVDTVYKAALRLQGEPQLSADSSELKQEISQLTQDKQDLLEQVKSLQASLSPSRHSDTTDSGKDLEEEKLKWQMEMENMRRELSAEFESEREGWLCERRVLEDAVGSLRENVERLESQGRVGHLEAQLQQAQARVTELEHEVESGKERLGQLQVQKDKAVTDLIALRKTNKSMEKRMSESEERVPSPMNSLTLANYRPDTPEVAGRVVELERKLAELNTALTQVQSERDLLKSKVDRLTSGLHTTPDFGFKFKTGASVAGNNISSAAHNDPLLINNSVPPSDNGSEASNSDAPPPKPKRPPKELMSKLAQNESTENVTLETKIRTRTASFFKSIKTMMM